MSLHPILPIILWDRHQCFHFSEGKKWDSKEWGVLPRVVLWVGQNWEWYPYEWTSIPGSHLPWCFTKLHPSAPQVPVLVTFYSLVALQNLCRQNISRLHCMVLFASNPAWAPASLLPVSTPLLLDFILTMWGEKGIGHPLQMEIIHSFQYQSTCVQPKADLGEVAEFRIKCCVRCTRTQMLC